MLRVSEVTRNEARQELGYNPLDGLDEPLVPTNTTTSDNLPGNGGGSPPQRQVLQAGMAESVAVAVAAAAQA